MMPKTKAPKMKGCEMNRKPKISTARPYAACRLLQLALLSLLLSLSGLSLATPGLEVLESGPHYSGATYRETVRDLRVKVLGGYGSIPIGPTSGSSTCRTTATASPTASSATT